MDFAKSLMVLLRRWYVAVPALVVSLGLAAVVFETVPAKYFSSGTIVLLSPSQGTGVGGVKTQTNPLLSFDGSLTTVSTALIQVMLSPEIGTDLARQGALADYQVGDGNLGGPFIHVEATGSSPAQAQRTVELVLQRTATELRDREVSFHAPAASYIQVDYLVRPTEAKRLLGSKVRAAGAALALALAFSFSSAFMIESIAENRRARRAGTAARGGAGAGTATGAVTASPAGPPPPGGRTGAGGRPGNPPPRPAPAGAPMGHPLGLASSMTTPLYGPTNRPPGRPPAPQAPPAKRPASSGGPRPPGGPHPAAAAPPEANPGRGEREVPPGGTRHEAGRVRSQG